MLAEKIHSVRPTFDKALFVRSIRGRISDAAFFERQDIFADALEATLGNNYTKNLRTLGRILGPRLKKSTGMFTHGWWLWPVSRYVERHAVENGEASYAFIHELTQRFTGEFAIRPLLDAYPEETLAVMLEWSKDQSVHVRRLASEGVRTRLPWARKSRVALEHFKTYRTILTSLHTDPERFVQKSVGNNINDLMKEDPQKALTLIQSWCSSSMSPETIWIIRHGLRKHPSEIHRFCRDF
jgi:3-methyladenine DNA glycosylase AlkC